MKARAMADLTVRNVSQDVVDALKRRAAANGRSVEAEHRELLRVTLLGADHCLAARAAALLQTSARLPILLNFNPSTLHQDSYQ